MYEVSVCSCSSLTVCWLSPKGCTGLYAPETASAVHPAALASLCTLAEERLGFGLGAGAGAGAGAGCTGVWVYGYAGVWVYGCTGVWVYGLGSGSRLAAGTPSLAARLSAVTWLGLGLGLGCGRMGVWAYG